VSIDIGNGKLPVDETSGQFFAIVTSKGELVEKVLPTLSNDIDGGLKG
jgi:hypothetical protein